MATKRHLDQSVSDENQADGKQMRTGPSSAIIRDQSPIPLLCYYDGEWIRDCRNFFYDGGKSKFISVSREITYEMLLSRVYRLTNSQPEEVDIRIWCLFSTCTNIPMPPTDITNDEELLLFFLQNERSQLSVMQLFITKEIRSAQQTSDTTFIVENAPISVIHEVEPNIEPHLEPVTKLEHFSFQEPSEEVSQYANEEVQRGERCGARPFRRSPSLGIQALEAPTLQLFFSSKNLSVPVFTGSKIEDRDGQPLQILLVDTRDGQMVLTTLPYGIRVEIVVLDGDFPPVYSDDWTSKEFDNNIVQERTGKRPLLTGDVLLTVRDSFTLIGDLTFTDNSSWTRSRRFRLGARVAQGSCESVRVREAMTEPFVVKDQRGGGYKKHHPPLLRDNVWRLEKIGRDGVFHKKLAAEAINTVQDFLKQWVVDSTRLRNILGLGMFDKTWEATMKHARTCNIGSKKYKLCGPCYTIFVNPIWQVVGVMLNGQTYPERDLTEATKVYVENLVRDAYIQRKSLEEVDELLNENALLPPGDQAGEYPNHHQNIVGLTSGSVGAASQSNNSQGEYSDWEQNPTYPSATTEGGSDYTIPEGYNGNAISDGNNPSDASSACGPSSIYKGPNIF